MLSFDTQRFCLCTNMWNTTKKLKYRQKFETKKYNTFLVLVSLIFSMKLDRVEGSQLTRALKF